MAWVKGMDSIVNMEFVEVLFIRSSHDLVRYEIVAGLRSSKEMVLAQGTYYKMKTKLDAFYAKEENTNT